MLLTLYKIGEIRDTTHITLVGSLDSLASIFKNTSLSSLTYFFDPFYFWWPGAERMKQSGQQRKGKQRTAGENMGGVPIFDNLEQA